MNSVVLLDPEHTVLVDPGVLPKEIGDIAAVVREAKPAALTLVYTHSHWDHILGRPWWPAADSIAHDRFASEMEAQKAHIVEEMTRVATEAGQRFEQPFQTFRARHTVSGLHFRKVGPWRLVFRDAFGHARDQLSVHLPERGILICADMLSAIETPELVDPASVYRRTIEDLAVLVEGGAVETLIPGHGPLARGREQVLARIHADLGHLDALERR
jgi:glyoxylase-like metal-dependent hydrolase (beta-lactamase superfamily II)